MYGASSSDIQPKTAVEGAKSRIFQNQGKRANKNKDVPSSSSWTA